MVLVAKLPELCDLIPWLLAGPGRSDPGAPGEELNVFYWVVRYVMTWVTRTSAQLVGIECFLQLPSTWGKTTCQFEGFFIFLERLAKLARRKSL